MGDDELLRSNVTMLLSVLCLERSYLCRCTLTLIHMSLRRPRQRLCALQCGGDLATGER